MHSGMLVTRHALCIKSRANGGWWQGQYAGIDVEILRLSTIPLPALQTSTFHLPPSRIWTVTYGLCWCTRPCAYINSGMLR